VPDDSRVSIADRGDRHDDSHGEVLLHDVVGPGQLERDRLIERTRAGLVAAKARGRTGGRKPKLSPDQIEMARGLLENGKPPRDVANAFNVGRSTLYRALGTQDSDDTTNADGDLKG